MQKSKCDEVVKSSSRCNVWHIVGAQEGPVAAHLIITISPTGKASVIWGQGLASGLQLQSQQEEGNSRHLEGQPLRSCLLSSLSLEGSGAGGVLGRVWALPGPLQLAAVVAVGWSRVGRVITSYISGRPDP